MVIAATRPDFERYFLESRKSKGANRKPTFERFPDDTYKDDHTQRHWWTWQQSVLATRAQALEDAAAKIDSEGIKGFFPAQDAAVADWLRALKGKQ